jgi:hypothetical protein
MLFNDRTITMAKEQDEKVADALKQLEILKKDNDISDEDYKRIHDNILKQAKIKEKEEGV